MTNRVYYPIGLFPGFGLSLLHPNQQLSHFGKILGEDSASDGGKARAASLTPKQRSDIAKKAARTRWDTPREENIRDVLNPKRSLFIRGT
jgi:hypothetical protein